MPDSGGAPGIYSSRPKLTLDGREEPSLGQQLLELFVEETTEGLYRCEATFVNWGPKDGSVNFLYFGRDVLEFGKSLKIEMGAGDAAGVLFEGRVTGIEGRFAGSRPPEILILAEDRLQDLRMTRRTRTFENVSDAEVVRQVAGSYGLGTDVDFSGPTHQVVAQLNQSDLAFVRERARGAGAEVWVEGDTMKAKPRTARSGGELTLTYGDGLHELSIMADLAHQATGLTVAGWNVSGKRAVSHRATDTAVGPELNGGEAGAAVLQATLGARNQQVVHDHVVNEEEARALADAHFRASARRFVEGHGLAEGDARIRVGAEIDLREVGPLFAGKYFVTSVRHTFDETHGFRSTFTVERPTLGRPV
jgi:uncharacterized protein